MEEITLITILTDYEETYEIKNNNNESEDSKHDKNR